MRRITWIFLLSVMVAGSLAAQSKYDFISNNQPMRVGAYYYPEHWPKHQWERDLKRMADLGFEFTHYAEFAWSKLEPREGEFNFGWLDTALNIAEKNGIKVILCTQSCTPPAWLANKHPEILLMDEDYHRMEHGTRANMSFANDTFRYYVARMTEEIARRYGNHPNVIGWQLHNEPYGHKDFSPVSQEKFRVWLKKKYKTIDALNKAWGNEFWSQTYNNFDQIRIPSDTYTGWGINPHQIMDYKRYNADMVAEFLDFQTKILRKYLSDDQWVTTNYISNIELADPRRTTELDFTSFTCYLVFGEYYLSGTMFRNGWPQGIDFGTALHKPIDGITGIMELQPGQVNWGNINPQVAPGAVRMWLWNAYGAGNNYVCNYRFRQPLFGSEQFHYGILNTDGKTLAPGGVEYVQFIEELNKIKDREDFSGELPKNLKNTKTAILWTQENRWDLNGQKQTEKWNSLQHVFKYFDAVRSTGAPIELIDETYDLSTYKYLIIPAFQQVNKQMVTSWQQFAENGGHVVISCRTGMKDPNGHLWEGRWSEPIVDFIGAEIEFFDLLPHGEKGIVKLDESEFEWDSWGEVLKPFEQTSTLAIHANQFYSNKPAVTTRKIGNGSVTYIGIDSKNGLLEKSVLRSIYQTTAKNIWNLPEGVYLNWRNGLYVVVNYSTESQDIPVSQKAEILLGKKLIEPAGVLIWQE